MIVARSQVERGERPAFEIFGDRVVAHQRSQRIRAALELEQRTLDDVTRFAPFSVARRHQRGGVGIDRTRARRSARVKNSWSDAKESSGSRTSPRSAPNTRANARHAGARSGAGSRQLAARPAAGTARGPGGDEGRPARARRAERAARAEGSQRPVLSRSWRRSLVGTVGILANPMSGRDVRRLAARPAPPHSRSSATRCRARRSARSPAARNGCS